MGVFLIFVDGIGLGGADPASNPFMRAHLPTLSDLLGGQPLTDAAFPRAGPVVWARAADSRLGVGGLPQSATGQTAILTGQNAAMAIGRHLNAYPTPTLCRLLAEHSLFKRVSERGLRAAFLNAYRPEFFTWLATQGHGYQWWYSDAAQADRPTRGQLAAPSPFLAPTQAVRGASDLAGVMRRRGFARLRPSASTVAVLAAGLPFRTLDDLRAGRAVYHDITNGLLTELGLPVPTCTPEAAGNAAADTAAGYDFAMYEHFLTDLVGHKQDMNQAMHVLETLDGFLAGVLRARAPQTTVLMLSDHGNLEDLSTRGHTLNPVPVLAVGPAAAQLTTDIASLTDVAPAILTALAATGPAPGGAPLSH